MKVNIGLDFTDAQLRTIRAAHGRGGVATRKDARIFIYRAVEMALQDAPTAKPARKRLPKPPPPPKPTPLSDAEELARAKAARDAIKRSYRV